MRDFRMNFFTKLSNKLSKTKDKLVGNIDNLLSRWKKADPALLEELEEVLISADTGAIVAEKLIEKVKRAKVNDPGAVKETLKEGMLAILSGHEGALRLPDARPAVVVIVGVNGTGKTTTIGKMAERLRREGKKVVIAAADTFRAAAIEQLVIWGERSRATVIRHTSGADPAAVVYDALAAAKARGADVLIVDTAGRLHTKVNLMEELKKIRRVLEREHPGSPHEVLLVLDATAGQNSLVQARIFSKDVGITGIVLTKLDGTAKGGIILGITEELKIPVKLIGVGEGIDDRPAPGRRQKQTANALPQRGPPRLARDHRVQSLLAEKAGEATHLGRLAAALPAFEGDEETAHGVDLPSARGLFLPRHPPRATPASGIAGLEPVLPHDDRVLAGVLVVPPAAAAGIEPVLPVEVLGNGVGGADLQGHASGAALGGAALQFGEEQVADPPAAEVLVDGDVGDVGLVEEDPHAGVADHPPVQAGHDVMGVGVVAQFRGEGPRRPGREVGRALDGGHLIDVPVLHLRHQDVLKPREHPRLLLPPAHRQRSPAWTAPR